MTSVAHQDVRMAALIETLTYASRAVSEFRDTLRYINDDQMHKTFQPILEAANEILAHHQKHPNENIADDIAHLHSLFSRVTAPREDPDLGPLLALKELRSARGNLLSELNDVLLATRELGWLPSDPELPYIHAEGPYLGLESLLPALLKRLNEVESLLGTRIKPEGVPNGKRSDVQVILVTAYTGSMENEINLVRIEAAARSSIDFSALSRTIGNIGRMTADFIATVEGFGLKATVALREAAEAIRPKVKRVLSGLSTLVRQVARRQKGTRKQGEDVSPIGNQDLRGANLAGRDLSPDSPDGLASG